MNEIEQLTKFLEGSKKVLVMGHMKPDHDAVCSALSMSEYLKLKYDLEVRVAFSQEYTGGWKDIPLIDNVEWVGDVTEIISEFDTLVFLDANILKRFSDYPERINISDFKTVCIDHHESEADKFGLDLSDASAAAVAGLVYKYFWSHEKSKITKDLAYLMMLGIVADSGSFRFLRPEQSETLLYVKDLLEIGEINLDSLALSLSRITPRAMEIYKMLMENMQVVELEGVPPFVYSFLPMEVRTEHGYTTDDISKGGGNFKFQVLKQIKGHDWGFVVTPVDEDNFSISFRSMLGAPIVNGLARELGGDGHPYAAAGRYKISEKGEKSAEQICEEVIKVIKDSDLEIAS